MWVIRLVVFLLLLFVLVYVFAANAGQTVDLNFFGREYPDLALFWVVAASFGLGFLAALTGMGAREWRHRRDIGRLRKQNAIMDKELADLRTLPLQELDVEPATKDDRGVD